MSPRSNTRGTQAPVWLGIRARKDPLGDELKLTFVMMSSRVFGILQRRNGSAMFRLYSM